MKKMLRAFLGLLDRRGYENKSTADKNVLKNLHVENRTKQSISL